MSEPRRSYAAYLKPDAFKPYQAPEVKGSPYPADVKIISSYPMNEDTSPKAIQNREAFQKQFFALLEAFNHWGRDNKCADEKTVSGITTLRTQLFDPSYSGMQTPLYFESIKQNLEKILLVLRDDKIPLNKRKETYASLCPNFAVCGPGLFTHIEAAQHQLTSSESPDKWLAELRTSLIRHYADMHSQKKRIPAGNSIHVFNGFANYACDQKWNPLHAKIQDPLMVVAQIEEEDITDFYEYFNDAYNPNVIRSCIDLNVNLMIRGCLEECGFKQNQWNSTQSKDYGAFIKKIKIDFANIGISFSEQDFFEFDDDYTQFRLCNLDSIVDKLCEPLLNVGPQIYFDTAQKKYINLVPAHWMNDKLEASRFVFNVWNQVPNEKFTEVLFELLKVLPIKYFKSLLENLPVKKLQYMVEKDQEPYGIGISKIDNKEKRESILDTITKITSPKENKHSLMFFSKTAEQLMHPELALIGKLILQGEEKDVTEVLTLINKKPDLLHCVTMATDPLGRRVKGTLLQIAAMAGDVDLRDGITEAKQHGLVERIVSLNHLSPDEVKEQLQCVTSEEAVAENNARNKRIMDAVTKFGEGLIRSNVEPNFSFKEYQAHCKPLIDQLEKDLQPDAKAIVSKGYVYDPKILADAMQWFEKNVDRFGGWWSKKTDVFWLNGVGKLQGKLSSRDAQAVRAGIALVYYDRLVPVRTLNNDDGSSYFFNSRSRLGLDFYLSNWGRGWHSWGGGATGSGGGAFFKSYCQTKTRALQELCNASQRRVVVAK